MLEKLNNLKVKPQTLFIVGSSLIVIWLFLTGQVSSETAKTTIELLILIKQGLLS